MTRLESTLRIAIFHNLEACGAKRALWHFAELLAQHGHELDLYTLSTSDETFLPLRPYVKETFTEELTPLKLTIPAKIPMIDQGKNLWRRLHYLKTIQRAHQRLAHQINARNYDLAFITSGMYAHVPELLRYLRVPSVFFCQEPSRKIHNLPVTLTPLQDEAISGQLVKFNLVDVFKKIDGLFYAFTEPIYKKKYHNREIQNLQFATKILTNSYYTRELTFSVYGIFPHVNYLGIDSQRFRILPGIEKKNLVLSVGRFDVLKQHHILIESVGKIPRSFRPEVAIVGETINQGYVAYLRQLAEKCEVVLHIHVSASEEELIVWYNRAKVVVFVPILEPFGFISLEAMACGTPIVAVREGGIREVILHEKTGLLVDRDPLEISGAILRILREKELAEQLSKQGREYVCQEWSWQKSFDQLMKHFESVLR